MRGESTCAAALFRNEKPPVGSGFRPVYNSVVVFSSFLFLFCFFPLVALCYVLTPRVLKNSILFAASVIFYAWGAPQVVPFLLLACAFDFFLSPFLVPGRIAEKQRRFVFGIAVAANLSALLYYKYFHFFVVEISRVFRALGFQPLTISEVVLPIGISFFTFHKISYLGDIFRGKVLPARSLVDYCLYILFFPQLIAGPIIRYADVAMQFSGRVHSIDGVCAGLTRLCLGLGKKVLIADSLGAVANQILGMQHQALSAGAVWLAVFCYSFQIFFDFSGYSDMAIGLAKVFGFTFKENFDRPYLSRNFTEFWRRWHISLSTFMREYLYIPLGGNRGSALRTTVNLWITFLLSGLWHGASWNFVIWGAFHGAFLTIDKIGWEKLSLRLPAAVSVGITFLLVTVGWVFFRAETLAEAVSLLQIMSGFGAQAPDIARASLIDNRQIAMLMIAIAASFTFLPRKFEIPAVYTSSPLGATRSAGFCLGALLLFWLSIAALASRGYTPFLYFKF